MRAMVPPSSFHGSASEADDISGGGSNSVAGGIGGVAGATGGATPMCLMNVAGPCSRQTPGVNWSAGSWCSDERRPPLSPVRTPWK